MKLRLWPVMFLVLAIGLAACEPGAGAESTVAPTQATAAPSNATDTPASAAETSLPAPTGMPPQTNAAEVRPAERRAELTRLSALIGFQVLGLHEEVLGKVSDYILNTCETYIVYFVVEPAASLGVASGKRLVIPFEAVTINSGALDAAAKAVVLYLTPEQLRRAPTSPDPLQLLPNEWETGVRDYWSQVVRVGKLSSECRAGGSSAANAVHKIAYATQLLGAELKDGNQNLLGTVQEGILEPETGKLGFYVVSLADGSGLVLVPLGKTNIPEAALKPGSQIELVLLADNGVLAGAPRIASVEQATSAEAQNAARGYWPQ